MTRRVGFGSFSLDVPDNWTLTYVTLSGPVEAPQRQGMLTAKAGPVFQRNLVTAMEAVGPDETVERFVQRQTEELSVAKMAPQDAGAPEPVTLADGTLKGLITERVVAGPDGARIRQMQLAFIKDGIAFIAIASNLDGAAFEASREEFRQMLISYR